MGLAAIGLDGRRALFQYDHWFENEAMQEGHVKEGEYDRVIGSSTSSREAWI